MDYKEAKASEAIRLINFPNKPLEGHYKGFRVIDTKDWGFDMLNRKLETIPKFCMCKVTYVGKKESKKPGQTYHDVTVLFNPDDKIQSTVTEQSKDDLP